MAGHRLIAGVMLGGLASGLALFGAVRSVSAGPGDPPVIVLPSARAAVKTGVVQVQATVPNGTPVMPKLEMLPPPSAHEPKPVPALPVAVESKPIPAVPVAAKTEVKPALAAPPLLVAPDTPLKVALPAPTLTPKEAPNPPPVVAKEVAPTPQPAVAKTVETLPPPAASVPVPSPLAPPGDTTMRTATAAALTAIIAASAPAAEPKPQDKGTEPIQIVDVKALKDEVEALRKQLTTLAGNTSEVAKSADLKALKDEIAALKKEFPAKETDGAKGADVKALKDEIALLKKDIGELKVGPNEDAKGMKSEVEALRKDVQALNLFVRESLDGKVEKGFTHDGVVKRIHKLDEAIDALSKKVTALDGKVGETRTAAYPPAPKAVEAALKSTVRVVNEYPIEISIVVNGVSHRLDPNARKDVPVAAGVFKYQLLTSGGAETERTIKENETVTLTIR